MAHEAAIVFKRNDKNTAPGKEYLGLKHGDPVDVIDNVDSAWKGMSIEELMSERMREAFCIVRIDPAKTPLFRQYLREHNGNRPPNEYRPRIKRVNVPKLANIAGISDLDEKMHTGENIPIINGMLLSEEDFDDATLLNNFIKFRDVKAIGAGAATIGVGGAAPNYLTFALGFADLVNLTGNLTFTQVSDLTEAATATMTETLGGFIFTCTNASNQGDYNAGFLIDLSHANDGFSCQQEGAGTTIFNGLKIIRTGVLAGGEAAVLVINIAAAFNFYITNCMFNLCNYGIRSSDNTPVLFVYNNIIWGALARGIRLDPVDGNASSVYENNSIYDCVISGFDINNNAGLFRNNSVLENSIDYVGIGAATGRNNAGSDGTCANGNWNVGTNNQINLVTANQWQSLVPGDGNPFLLPIRGSVIDTLGIAPTYATTLINGITWRGDIGAKGLLPAEDEIAMSQSHIAIPVGIGIF